MAHITLIRPPATVSPGNYSVDLIPPIGVAYVAAALEAEGHRVALIDALGEAPDRRLPSAYPGLVSYGLAIDEIVARIPRDTSAVGISAMFSQQWPHIEAMIRAIAQQLPGVPIFMGGEHATACWDHVLATCPEVAACVLGEGEITATELAAWVDGRRALEDIAGIAFRNAGQAQLSKARPRLRRPESLPWPAWHLAPVEQYLARGLGHGVNRGRSMPLLATRGCPFQCTFCSSPEMWTTSYVMRPVEDVVDEIESYIERYRVTNVDFVDLTVIVKRDWALAFCRELEHRNLKITYQLPSGTRSEALDREVLEALYRTGCRNITYAPESGSPSTLKRIKKRIRPERMLESMRTANQVGMVARANIIIGFPFEQRRDIWESLRFALQMAWNGVEDISFFAFCPYPGSEIHHELTSQGALPSMSNSYFAGLCFTDITQASNCCKAVGATEINIYRTLGMGLTLVLSYLCYPRRLLRTIRHLRRGDSESSFEKRLNLLVREPLRRRLKRLSTWSREAAAANTSTSAG